MNLLFNFSDLNAKDKASTALTKEFKKNGAQIIACEVSGIKKKLGVSFKELHLVFNDNQTIVLRIKETGDIFQVLFNGKIAPIKTQDDHAKACSELASMLQKNRINFQKKMARVKVKLPNTIKSTVPKIKLTLSTKLEEITKRITAIEAQITARKAQINELKNI